MANKRTTKGVDATKGKRIIEFRIGEDTKFMTMTAEELEAEQRRIVREEGLRKWWLEVAQADYAGASKKAAIYGSRDFEIMGVALRGGVEHAIAFYALGKVARALSSLERGDSPAPDTWDDLTAYSMIARRYRDSGRWP